MISVIVRDAMAQSVQVLLRPPPPYGFHIENMWNVTLSNTTKTNLRVYLRGIATLETEGLIADAHTSVFTLSPGTTVVNATEINPIHLDQTNPKYEAPVKHLGAVPNGNYEICVSVINAADGTVLGEECENTEVMNVSQLNLLSPDDGEVFAENITFPQDTMKTNGKRPREITLNQSQTSSNVIFSWLPPSPVNSSVRFTYRLKIAQELGSQSAYDAMQSNPLYYSSNNLAVTSYQYPLAARHLTSGKYAWQVEAYLDGTLVSSSDIWEFRFGSETKSGEHDLHMYWLKKQWALKDETGPGFASGGNFNSKPFLFSFDSKIYGENANRSGTGSDQDPRYGYIELTPSVSLFGFPFGSSILISSENSAIKQSINSAGLNLDVSAIKDFITDKIESEKDKILEDGKNQLTQLTDQAKDKLQSEAQNNVMSKLNPALKIISYFKQLGLGTTYPDYTPLTVHGVPLTGANLEFNPGWLYVAVGGFKNQKPIDNSAYRRDLYTGRIGIGQKDDNHIYLTGMFAKDEVNSIVVDTSNNTLTPKANYVFGMEGMLNLFRKKLSLQGEISGAMLTRDTRDADLDNSSIPSFVKNLLHPKISSSADFAYTLKGIFNNEKSNTKIQAGMKMIGPGYASLGVPTLATDKLEVNSKIDQKLLNNRLSLKASFTWSRDNLINWKTYTTSYIAFLLSANYTPRNLPFFNITYSPTFQKNNATDVPDIINNKFHSLIFSTGHYYRKWDINFNSSLNYVMNISNNQDSLSNSSSQSLQYSQTFGFAFPLSLTASVGFIFSKLQGVPDRTISADFSGNYVFEDLITVMAGLSTGYEKDLNKKNSSYLGISGGFKQYLNIELRAEKNMYYQWFDNTNDYNEFLIRCIVTMKF